MYAETGRHSLCFEHLLGHSFEGLEYMYSDRCQFDNVNIMRFIMTYILDS